MDNTTKKTLLVVVATSPLLLLLLTKNIRATPLYHDHDIISNPCMDNTSTYSANMSLEEETLQTLAALRHLVNASHGVMTAYEENGLLLNNETAMLLSPFMNLNGLPVRSSAPCSDIVQQLNSEYHDVSVFLVFLRHAQNQQIIYDDNLLKEELDTVAHSLLSVLCRLDTSLKYHRATPCHIAFPCAMSDQLRSMREDKDRYTRDFLFMKSTKVYFEAMTCDYEDMYFDSQLTASRQR